MATVFLGLGESGMVFSYPPRIIEIARQKNSGCLEQLGQAARRASAFDAAFFQHVFDKAAHHRVVGVADQGRALARLCHQPDPDQRLEMVRQRRGGDVEALLQLADCHPLLAGAHQRAVDAEPSGVAESLQADSGVVELHAPNVARRTALSTVFLEYSKYVTLGARQHRRLRTSACSRWRS